MVTKAFVVTDVSNPLASMLPWGLCIGLAVHPCILGCFIFHRDHGVLLDLPGDN